MATNTAVYEIADRVIVTAATAGFPAEQPGTVVGAYWYDSAWVYIVRVPDDVHGNTDLHLAGTAITPADEE